MNKWARGIPSFVLGYLIFTFIFYVIIPSETNAVENVAGDANDFDLTTFKFASDNSDRRLTREDGTPILPYEVPGLYGTSDGFTIFNDALDVTSGEYSDNEHLNRPLKPVYQDLSDGNGWPKVHVTPGSVAIDPLRGRFKFSEGDDLPISQISSLDLPNGRAMDMKVIGNYAYLANDEVYMGLTIIDISDPNDPRITGYCRAGLYPSALDVIFPYAYVMDGYNLYIFDISNPYNPRQISKSDSLGKGAYGIDVEKFGLRTIAFCGSISSSGKSTLHVFDVTFPHWVRLITTLEFDWSDSVFDVKIKMPYAFVSVKSKGVLVVDVSNFYSPQLLASYDAHIERGCQVDSLNSYLFISDYNKGLRILDISDISCPNELYFDWYLDDLDNIFLDSQTKHEGNQSVHFEDCRSFLTSKPIPVASGQEVHLDFWAKGYQTYDDVEPVRGFAGGYQILWDGVYKSPHVAGLIRDTSDFTRFTRDFTVPEGVTTMQLRLSSGMWGSSKTRGTMWFDQVNLAVEDVNTLGNPGFEDRNDRFLLGYTHPRGISFSNGKILVSDYSEGVRIILAMNPEDLRVICRFKDENEEYSTFIRGVITEEYAYLVEQFWGIKTLSLQVPTGPRLLGNVCTTGFVQDVVVLGSYAYVANTFSGIWTVNISNPLSPHIVGGYHTGDSIDHLAIDDYGYLYCYNNVLGRIDVLDIMTNPESPGRIGSAYTFQVMKMITKGNKLFVASNKNPDLYIFDITDPTKPVLKGALEITNKGGYRGLAVSNDICAMACFEGGFHLIDVSDSENPLQLGSFDKDDEYPWAVALLDDLAYVSYRNKFIRIFDISDIENPMERGMVYDDLKWPWNILISRNLMHVTDYKGGVITYDISDPIYPIQIDRLNHSLAVDLDLQGEFLYEGQYGSLKILDCMHSSQAPNGIVTVKYNFRNLILHGIFIAYYQFNLKHVKRGVYFNSSGP